MKKHLHFIFFALIVSFGYGEVLAQGKAIDPKYRRSSLHTILMESQGFPKREIVVEAYTNAPFPQKYNNHSLTERTFDPTIYPITDDEREAAGVKKGKMKNALLGGASNATMGIIDANAADNLLIIEKYFKDKKIPNQVIAKWFERNEKGAFNMNLIAQRGSYNASTMEANIAKGTARGLPALADAGEELLHNTFVVVNKLNFVENEVVAKAVLDMALLGTAEMNDFAKTIAELAATKVYEKTREGYSVWTTSYLYQLEWNDSVAAVFYQDYWMDESNLDEERKTKFDESDLFKLKFVGKEKARSLVTFKLKEQRTEEEILALATVRNVDAVYAKLQKKYDVFKTKTPLVSSKPLAAQIGMKEGLKGGEKFEVLEQRFDEKTGRTVYVRKGKITVNKKAVWDNRFNAGEEGPKGNDLNATEFKGSKKLYPGLLIRQIK